MKKNKLLLLCLALSIYFSSSQSLFAQVSCVGEKVVCDNGGTPSCSHYASTATPSCRSDGLLQCCVPPSGGAVGGSVFCGYGYYGPECPIQTTTYSCNAGYTICPNNTTPTAVCCQYGCCPSDSTKCKCSRNNQCSPNCTLPTPPPITYTCDSGYTSCPDNRSNLCCLTGCCPSDPTKCKCSDSNQCSPNCTLPTPIPTPQPTPISSCNCSNSSDCGLGKYCYKLTGCCRDNLPGCLAGCISNEDCDSGQVCQSGCCTNSIPSGCTYVCEGDKIIDTKVNCPSNGFCIPDKIQCPGTTTIHEDCFSPTSSTPTPQPTPLPILEPTPSTNSNPSATNVLNSSFTGLWKGIISKPKPGQSRVITLKLCVIGGELEGIVNQKGAINNAEIISQEVISEQEINIEVVDQDDNITLLNLKLLNDRRLSITLEGTINLTARKLSSNKKCLLTGLDRLQSNSKKIDFDEGNYEQK